MIKDHHYTCGHAACSCRVTPPSLYCSDRCQQQVEFEAKHDHAVVHRAKLCACGHDACAATPSRAGGEGPVRGS
ncbi:hypothetical protein ACQVBX_01050 [Dyella sp. KULCS107]|uniref:hypothetical protein n=1 Tax=Dyella sp. KULCS107 TaxID=3422216 RepID=UPI003D6FA0D4